MIVDATFFALAVPAVLLSGISKGGLSGLGALAVPMLTLVIPPGEAAGLMLPILCLMDLFGLWAYRGTWSREQMKVLLLGALIGIGVGVLAFGHLNDNAVRAMIGVIAILFSINQWLKPLLQRKLAEAPPPSAAKGLFWSGVSGFTSFLAHAGGPPILIYLLPQRMEKMLLAGTTVVFFGVVNFVKLIPYFWLGQLSGGNLTTSLMLAPLAPIGIWMGVWLTKRVSEALFYRVSFSLLFLAGLKLLYDGLA
ncbi:membrane protein [Skermanella stibiiresistens SB22]|uniref:Probable membrane transporter protein n=1 Tax=Skermanella stibiiresistens SB22 TaxID=1385369 RepID=W9GUU6_9PROT|nr:sulfite exporter TauE/SafE family protein [Skermanella stibiiresistens]EWY36441.1 membrane protein [Skermanella stibiiresistens SB22]